jgi:hypothetical protein
VTSIVGNLDSSALLSNISVSQTSGQVAQSVEQRTENPRVGGSIPSLAIFNFNNLHVWALRPCLASAGFGAG